MSLKKSIAVQQKSAKKTRNGDCGGPQLWKLLLPEPLPESSESPLR